MPEYSGAGFRAHNLYKRLTAAHQEISLKVLCGSETENTLLKYEHDGFSINRISCKKYPVLSKGMMRFFQISRNFQAEYSQTLKYLESLPEKPDLIHVFGKNYVNAAALDYAAKQNIPSIIELVCEMNTPFQFVPFPNRLFVSDKFPDRCKVVCISEKLHEVCLSAGIEDRKIWTRLNPVNEKIFYPVDGKKKNELRAKNSKFSEKDILIAYVAKFRPSKNHGFLIDVLKKLPENYKLFIKGPLVASGPLEKRDRNYFEGLGRKIKEYKLEDRVELQSGFAENVGELYQMSDVYAFPSEQEGLGTPVLESLACAVPVVACRIPGVTDIMVNDGVNGFLSELKDDEFAARIQKAAGFTSEKRSSEADKIIKIAGTSVVDQKYYSVISELTGDRKDRFR